MFEEKTVTSRPIFQGRVFNVRVDTVVNAQGEQATREIVEHGECITVVPVDENGDIILVRQFRKALENELLELPAGGIEPGEDPVAAVKRELQEEIGFIPGKSEKLGGVYTSPGFCNEYLHLFIATELRPSRLTAEDSAGITLVRIKADQIIPMLETNQINDAKSVAGLLWYLYRYHCRNH
ncbi:MAG TPA: NUDIX hydrolase [Dehalococcoidales bacterium]|nr:NUDIX hydrolase [Dehalococcoidales bacterium]